MKKKKIRDILDQLSGNDTINMLKDILKQPEKEQLNDKFVLSLSNLGKIYLKPKTRYQYIQCLKKARISFRTSKTFNFKASSFLWKNSDIANVRHKGGRKKISTELIEAIRDYLENISQIASNRTIKVDDEEIHVRYLTKSISSAYQNFNLKERISFSTFYSYVGKEFKKPHRLSDLCEYCELGKNLKKELLKFQMIWVFRIL